ncbi:MAG: transketolase C-terminal domain-containing protein [Ilumatobacteraceae bacterium]
MGRVNMSVLEMVERASAREVYGRAIADLATAHPDVVALTADLMGTNKFGDFKKIHPERFFNVGIAEQNLMGVAAGLALDGKVPFVSTFATFASMRAHEQVRTDIAYPNLPVKIIATVGGLSGGVMGPTHQGMEDVGVMRMMPNMTVIAPGDPLQLAQFVEQAYAMPGPVYIRLGRGNDPVVYDADTRLEIGRAILAAPGDDATIIVCGTVTNEAIWAAQRLAELGIGARVLDMHTIKPLDVDAVLTAASETGRIVTVEDHTVIGGLGSAVAEVVAGSGIACTVRRLGVPDVFGLVGPPDELYHHYGFDTDGIVAAVTDLVRG